MLKHGYWLSYHALLVFFASCCFKWCTGSTNWSFYYLFLNHTAHMTLVFLFALHNNHIFVYAIAICQFEQLICMRCVESIAQIALWLTWTLLFYFHGYRNCDWRVESRKCQGWNLSSNSLFRKLLASVTTRADELSVVSIKILFLIQHKISWTATVCLIS